MKLENAAGNNHSMTVRTPGWDPSFQIYDGQPNTDGWVEFVWNIDVQANYDQLSKLFFMPTITQWAQSMGFESVGAYIIGGLVGINFLIEFVINVVLNPAVVRLISFGKKK